MQSVDLSLHYPTDPVRVVEMFADHDFQARIAKKTAVKTFDIDSSGDPAGPFSLVVVRVVPADRLPDVARSVVGRELTVRQRETFTAAGPEGRTADITVDVDGVPVRLAGTETLRPDREDGGDGTSHSMHLEVTSSIPLIGGKIEKSAAPVITKALGLQESVAREWLAASST